MNTTQIDPVDIAVGIKVRDRRRALNISQQDLACLCGVTFQQVQKYERGANRISASRLFHIAKALSTTPGELFPDMDADLTVKEVDPVEVRARAIYKAARTRVKGRPAWENLNPADPYDKGMIDHAMSQARSELAAG